MAPPHAALLELARGGRMRPVVTDHEELVASAVEHRMHGLLWSAVQRGEVELDPAAQVRLAESVLEARAHHRHLWTSIASLVDRLEAAGVDVAVVKGVPVEAQWYDAAGERPCGDIDLLVAPHARNRVGDLVALVAPRHPLREHVQALVDKGALQSIELEVDGVFVDVHVDLFKIGVPSRQADAVWSRMQPLARPDGGRVRVPDAETALVHLLVHLNKDRFSRLLGFVDVARIVERSALDWSAIETVVRADGLDVPVWCSLSAVAEALGGDDLVAAATGRRPTGWRAATWRALWPERVRLQGSLGVIRYRYRQAWLPMLARGRAGETAWWWVRRLAPDPVLVAYRNPDGGRYVTRIIRGRWSRLGVRRRAAAQLRAGGSSGRTSARAASRAAG